MQSAQCTTNNNSTQDIGGGGEGSVIVGFSTTHGDITDCKFDPVVHAGVCGCGCGELIWTSLVWAERSTPDIFWVPSQPTDSIRHR